MKILWAIAYGIGCGLLGAGLIWLVARSPQGEAIQLLPAPTTAPMSVHVTGAVNSPGVYQLSTGSRVEDAIQAAGGFTWEAETEAINLAAFVEDGSQVRVPTRVAVEERSSTALININTADQKQLEALPGIGPETAKAIIAYREQHGVFKLPEEIQNVPGIGPVTFEQIKILISVTD